tara:strand:+ start:1675 stop:2244 length:570 start_codon:yes stop_codon:yes gene_type:complete
MEQNFIYEFKIDESLCDKLIDYHKNNTEFKREGCIINGDGQIVVDTSWKESIDVQFYITSNNSVCMEYLKKLRIAVQEYQNIFELNRHEIAFINLLQYYKPNGGFKKWHHERPTAGTFSDHVVNRSLVYTTYLNDVDDKGETEFMYQKLKIKPKKGKSIIFPADFTHRHRGIPSPTQEKYIATGWFLLQ